MMDARLRAVEDAIHSLRMEGLKVSEIVKRFAEQYVAGEIDSDELVRRVLALHGLDS